MPAASDVQSVVNFIQKESDRLFQAQRQDAENTAKSLLQASANFQQALLENQRRSASNQQQLRNLALQAARSGVRIQQDPAAIGGVRFTPTEEAEQKRLLETQIEQARLERFQTAQRVDLAKLQEIEETQATEDILPSVRAELDTLRDDLPDRVNVAIRNAGVPAGIVEKVRSAITGEQKARTKEEAELARTRAATAESEARTGKLTGVIPKTPGERSAQLKAALPLTLPSVRKLAAGVADQRGISVSATDPFGDLVRSGNFDALNDAVKATIHGFSKTHDPQLIGDIIRVDVGEDLIKFIGDNMNIIKRPGDQTFSDITLRGKTPEELFERERRLRTGSGVSAFGLTTFGQQLQALTKPEVFGEEMVALREVVNNLELGERIFALAE